jgi:hypothetical protein
MAIVIKSRSDAAAGTKFVQRETGGEELLYWLGLVDAITVTGVSR